MAKSAEVKCVEEKVKNIYYRAREACRMSREDAVDQLGISMTKLGRIERGETAPQAEDVVAMAEAYGDKSLFNYYCSKECEIGFKCRVDEVRPVGLAEATLGIIASVNAFNSFRLSSPKSSISFSAASCLDRTNILATRSITSPD